MCEKCKNKKEEQGLYEWYGLEKVDEIPRKVEAEYLRFLYSLHKENKTLDIEEIKRFCEICRLEPKCLEKCKLILRKLKGFVRFVG
ncbi:MAG: hypothetical protein ACTSSG_11755 [Candidatus Heimdallarchaeaceae archaeon]